MGPCAGCSVTGCQQPHGSTSSSTEASAAGWLYYVTASDMTCCVTASLVVCTCPETLVLLLGQQTGDSPPCRRSHLRCTPHPCRQVQVGGRPAAAARHVRGAGGAAVGAPGRHLHAVHKDRGLGPRQVRAGGATPGVRTQCSPYILPSWPRIAASLSSAIQGVRARGGTWKQTLRIHSGEWCCWVSWGAHVVGCATQQPGLC